MVIPFFYSNNNPTFHFSKGKTMIYLEICIFCCTFVVGLKKNKNNNIL